MPVGIRRSIRNLYMTRNIKRDHPPEAWQLRWKYYINKLCKWIKLKEPFTLSIYNRFATPSNWQRNIENTCGKIKEGSNLLYGICLLLFCLLIVFVWGEKTSPSDRWVEFWGLIFDVFFILVVFELFRQRLTKQSLVQKYKEIIEDYKCWDSEEAQFRIGGAVRRLRKNNISSFDFSGWKVSGFDFKSHKIESIDGSTFYDVRWMDRFKPKKGYLKRVDFTDVSCCRVIFSGGILGGIIRGLQIEDCIFSECDLSGADFSAAELIWSETPPEDHYEVVDHEPNGQPIYAQVTRSPFSGANMMGVNFENVQFENADFRDAEHIEQAIFSNAKGLESCVFDDDEIKSKIISQSEYK